MRCVSNRPDGSRCGNAVRWARSGWFGKATAQAYLRRHLKTVDVTAVRMKLMQRPCGHLPWPAVAAGCRCCSCARGVALPHVWA